MRLRPYPPTPATTAAPYLKTPLWLRPPPLLKALPLLRALPLLVAAIGLAACASSDDDSDRGPDAGPGVEDRSTTPQPRPDLLVSAAWLGDHLHDPDIVILQVGPDRATYDQGHIPGAHFLPVSAILTEMDGNINELPPVSHLDSVFESVGVSNDSRVIVYGPPLAAARAFFTLDYLGHGDQTALLKGGLENWNAEGRPLSTESPQPSRGEFTPHPRPELVVDAGWIERHLDDPEVALIDARPEAQFSGAEAGQGVPRPGHIPGAGSLYWERLIVSQQDPVLKDKATLYALLLEAGVEPGDTVVTYCRTGMQASFAYFVSRYLGYETKLYDASFMDWSRRQGLPVDRNDAIEAWLQGPGSATPSHP